MCAWSKAVTMRGMSDGREKAMQNMVWVTVLHTQTKLLILIILLHAS